MRRSSALCGIPAAFCWALLQMGALLLFSALLYTVLQVESAKGKVLVRHLKRVCGPCLPEAGKG